MKKKEKKTNKKNIRLADVFPELTPEYFDNRMEELRVEANVQIIEDKFADLEEYLDREITEKEQDAILDIIDEFTPKDKDGNYLVDLLPFEYAWQIHQAKIMSIFEK